MIELSFEVLAGLLGKPVDELTNALKDGETLKPADEITAFMRDAIDEKIVSEKRTVADDQYSRGKKEALTLKERQLREKYGLDGRTLDDMFDELIEKSKVKPDMTPDDVRNTEIYKMDMAKMRQAVETAEQTAQQAREEYTQKLVGLKMRQRGDHLLKEHKFVVPESVIDTDAWHDLLFNRLNGKDVRVGLNDDGELVILDENGAVKNDDRLNPVSFDDHFVNTAKSLFKIAQSDDRKSAGNSGSTGGDGGADGNDAPKDQTEYLQRLYQQPDAKSAREYVEKYGAKFASTAN